MARRSVGVAAVLALLVLSSACGAARGGDDGPVTLEFFQFEPEAIQAFDRVIAGFEAEHPDIRVRCWSTCSPSVG